MGIGGKAHEKSSGAARKLSNAQRDRAAALISSDHVVFSPGVPLPTAINVLIEDWEDEGLYDEVARTEALELRLAQNNKNSL
jgi:hypothetical protein